jgi:hypothetical protein
MPREPKIVPISREEFERQKGEKAKRCRRFLVTGNSKIRDAISRESKVKGEHVWLDPEETVIVLLTAPGLIAEAPEATPEPAKTKADKAA